MSDKNAQKKSGRRLYRSTSDKVFGGVCGGLAAYLQLDVVLVRCIWAGSVLFGGLGFLPYILAWFIVPEEPADGASFQPKEPSEKSNAAIFWGAGLLALGIWFLFGRMDWFDFYPNHYRWHWGPGWAMSFRLDSLLPLLVIIVGVYYLMRAFRKDQPMTKTASGGVLMEKRLTRSTSDKMIAGVCGGLATYFNVDPSLVRVGFALMTLASGGFPGIVAYVVMMIVAPEDTAESSAPPAATTASEPAAKTEAKAKPKARPRTRTKKAADKTPPKSAEKE